MRFDGADIVRDHFLFTPRYFLFCSVCDLADNRFVYDQILEK